MNENPRPLEAGALRELREEAGEQVKVKNVELAVGGAGRAAGSDPSAGEAVLGLVE